MAINTREDLVFALHDIGAFKFGQFKLKSGMMSPFYLDLRVIISFPHVMEAVRDFMWKKVANLSFDCVCGVPYTALPMATALAIKYNKPMIIKRKGGAKGYGTKKAIEGVYHKGQQCLIVEDLVTSGLSVFETIDPLVAEGIIVKDVVVLVNREQGGESNLNVNGINLHAVFKITEVLPILLAAKRIDQNAVNKVLEFITNNQTKPRPKQAITSEKKNTTLVSSSVVKMRYGDRAKYSTNPSAIKLFHIMDTKKTNLCFSLDVTKRADVLRLADAVGPHICLLKTHIDIVEDFDPSLITELQALARKHNFLIFEDRKYADIGNTVLHQFSKGVYHVSEWSHITNAHALPGPGIVEGLKKVGMNSPNKSGLLLIAEMSSKDNYITPDYTRASVKLAEEHKDFVIGFICQNRLSNDPGFLHMTPGVKMQKGGDALGQQYTTPESVIGQRQCDVIIVGRGIYGDANPGAAASTFRQAGWNAYLNRLGSAKL